MKTQCAGCGISDDLHKTVHEYADHIVSLENELTEMRRDWQPLGKLIAKIAELECLYEHADAERIIMTDRCNELEQQLATEKKRVQIPLTAWQDARLQELFVKNEQLEAQLSAAQEREAQLNFSNATITELRGQLEKMAAEQDSLKQQLAAAQERERRLRNLLIDVADELSHPENPNTAKYIRSKTNEITGI